MNLKNINPDLESPGILLKVLECPGIFNSEKRDCKNGILLESNIQVTFFRTSLNRSTCPILLSILKDIENVVSSSFWEIHF